jgi:hypothetical protein
MRFPLALAPVVPDFMAARRARFTWTGNPRIGIPMDYLMDYFTGKNGWPERGEQAALSPPYSAC